MGKIVSGDFGGRVRAKAQLESLTTDFMQWVTPLLDTVEIQGDRRAACEAIYRDLARELAMTYADLTVRIRLPTNQFPEDIADLRHDVREAMTDLYLKLSAVAALALRRGLVSAGVAVDEGNPKK
jgi:hypothetical protein